VVAVTTPAAPAAATPQREHYDAIWARKTGGTPVEPIRPGTRIDMTARFIGTGITVIDIGCGRGALAALVRGRFARVVGLELSAIAAAQARDGGHLHYFTFGDLKQLAADCGLAVEHRHGIINAERYGLKNRALVALLGQRFVRQDRTFGILLVLRRRTGTPA
jgi:SAM-dependent methyltransferase